MEQEDDWNPDIKGESILKVKVINFSNEIIDQNLDSYNSKPTPHEDIESDEQEKLGKMITQEQNLYDPLNDEQEQAWVDKKLKKSSHQLPPLVCPGCFTALCYQYKRTSDEDVNVSKQVVNCKYNPYPITTSDMSFDEKFGKEFFEKATNQELEKIKECITHQELGINMRFQLECEQCQNIVGYYETQNNQYKLINLI